MKPDKIHDALNLINDEWIEAVEKLRSNRKRKKIWYENFREILVVAACLCLMLLGIYSVDHFNLFSSEYDAVAESADETAQSVENTESAVDCTESVEESESAESAGEIEEWVRTAYVKIVEWHPDGFVGTVTDTTKLDAYDIGTELFVKFDEHSYIEIYTDTISYFADGIPNPQEIPVGTEAYVYFDEREVHLGTPESGDDVKIIVHADVLTSEYWY